jgi:catalase
VWSRIDGAAISCAFRLMAKKNRGTPAAPNAKQADLEPFRRDPTGQRMTGDTGVRISHTDDSLKAGERGPSLIEDFHLREKITRFDHERIPERVVHARGSAAHGVFQVYESQARITKAGFLQDPAKKTPVFVRFSTVAGSRGSADTVRDVRGFAVRFYTDEGNVDLVGNNMPVFFIQDGIKFPDLIHAVKAEPHNEIPGASSAHDTFYDFISLVPESTHMIMWLFSDRAIPRSLATMEGFGVHTFRLINAQGKSRFVKWHWKPMKGMHSLVWDEAQKLAGKDGDFHRRDLWDSIERGDFPEWELGVQIIEESQASKLGFDLLDPTKLVPEELIPVQRIGRMTLNRNPDNFFAETEQVAFHLGNLVPGIDVTNDPLLQARLFSYLDTQLTRLGGPNFQQLPINKPVAPVFNHQSDGFHQSTVRKGVAYHPNTLGGGSPALSPEREGGYVHFPEPVSGTKIRQRSESFADHFSQATLFYNSMSAPEKQHLVDAACFELSKVETVAIRERMVANLAQVDDGLAAEVAEAVGVAAPAPARARGKVRTSPALSMADQPKDSIKGRMVAFLLADGFTGADVDKMRATLTSGGALVRLVSHKLGKVTSAEGKAAQVDKTFQNSGSIFFDAVYVPGGAASVETLLGSGDALHFVNEAFRHCKAIAATGEGEAMLDASEIPDVAAAAGVVTGDRAGAAAAGFVAAIAAHRHWDRDDKAVSA